jgi:hypothetical protein
MKKIINLIKLNLIKIFDFFQSPFLSKNILHLQIPLIPDVKYGNALAISPEILGKFVNLIQNKLGKKWKIITSPCIPTTLNKKGFKNFLMENFTKEEILNLIK